MTLKPEHIVEELDRTPKLKRDLIMKMMEVMLLVRTLNSVPTAAHL